MCQERPPLWCVERKWPAAHSMDTEWFAIDAQGHVAILDTYETGALPEDAFCCPDDWYISERVRQPATHDVFWGLETETLPRIVEAPYTTKLLGSPHPPSLAGLHEALEGAWQVVEPWPPPMLRAVILRLRDDRALRLLEAASTASRELRGQAFVDTLTALNPYILHDWSHEVLYRASGLLARLRDAALTVYVEALFARDLQRLMGEGGALGLAQLRLPAHLLDVRRMYHYGALDGPYYALESPPEGPPMRIQDLPPVLTEYVDGIPRLEMSFARTERFDLLGRGFTLRQW